MQFDTNAQQTSRHDEHSEDSKPKQRLKKAYDYNDGYMTDTETGCSQSEDDGSKR